MAATDLGCVDCCGSDCGCGRSRGRRHGSKSDALSFLLGAAAALPGISVQAGDAGYLSQKTDLSYHHAQYEETGDRMSVRTDQLMFRTPLGDAFEVNGTLIRDITSGASPVINFLDLQGNPQQFLETGASIRDQRDIYEVSLGHYGDEHYSGLKLGSSKEDDYESRYISVSYRKDFNQKTTTLFTGAGYNSDDVWNSYNSSVLLEEPSEFHKRRKREFMLGASQILNKDSVVQFNLGYSKSSGFLSDPYKKSYVVDEGLFDFRGLINVAWIFKTLVKSGLVQFLNDSGITKLINESPAIDVPWLSSAVFGLVKDTRPSDRYQWTGLVRYSQYFEATESALHLDYRYAYDEWDADSHTFEMKWNVDFGSGIQLSPGLRYYTQHSAFFYDTFFEEIPSDGYVTSDYRLAGFGAVSKKLELSLLLTNDYTLAFHYEHYDRRHQFELGGGSKGDSLDDYKSRMISVSLDGRF